VGKAREVNAFSRGRCASGRLRGGKQGRYEGEMRQNGTSLGRGISGGSEVSEG